MLKALRQFWQTRKRNRPQGHSPRRTRLAVEALEDRLALSWSAIPPAAITVPSTYVSASGSGGVASSTGAITANEVDYYRLTPTMTSGYRIHAERTAGSMDPVAALFDDAGRRIGYNNDVSATDNASEFVVNLNAGKRYYLGITNLTGSGSGNYNWIMNPAAPLDDRNENNDTFATAHDLGTLTTTQTFSNLILSDSADWFRFTMSGFGTALAGDTVSLSFRNSQGNLDLKLYDDRQVELRSSANTTNGESTPLATRRPGTYYVKVFSTPGEWNHSYSLTINPGTDDGYENNDTRSTAYNLGTLTATRTLSNLQMADAADWYRFTLEGFGTSAHYARINFQNAQGNLELNLQRWSATASIWVQVADSTSTGNEERVSLDGLAPGEYCLRVWGANAAQSPSYTLEINPPLDDSYENNDSQAQAANLGLLSREFFTDNRVMADGDDWYRFTMEATGTRDSLVRIDFQHSLGDLRLELYDEYGRLRDSSNGSSDWETVSLTSRGAGTYWVRVSGVGNALNPNYTLFIAPGTDDPFEDNDSVGAATDLGVLDEDYWLTELKLLDNQDYFRFTMPLHGQSGDFVGVYYHWFISEGSYFDEQPQYLDLELLDSDGNPVGAHSVSEHGAMILLEGLIPGTYTARVFGVNGYQVDGYDLTVFPPTDDACEENDTLATAYDLGTPVSLSTTLRMSDEADWFRFRMEGFGDQGDQVSILNRTQKGSLSLAVYNSAGLPVGTAQIASNGEQWISLDGLRPGTYYIEVSLSDTNFGDEYMLTIRPGKDDRFEDNDTQDKAFSLGTLYGWQALSVAGAELADDNDWYSFFLPEGLTGFHVTLTSQYDQGNVDLEVYDANGSRLGRSRTKNGVENVALSGIPSDRLYFIRVYSDTEVDVGDRIVEETGGPQFNPNYALRIET